MSAYFIFVLVLSVAYAIYYAVMIALDLKKKPEVSNDCGEMIDVTAFQDEGSTIVSETTGGFSIGDNSYETSLDSASEAEGSNSGEAEKAQQIRDKIAELTASLEETPRQFENAMYVNDATQELLKKQWSTIKNEVTLHFAPITEADPEEVTV